MLGRSVPLPRSRCDMLLVQIQRDGSSASFLVLTLIVHATTPVFSLQAVGVRRTTDARHRRAQHQIVMSALLLCIIYLLGPHLFRLLPAQDQEVCENRDTNKTKMSKIESKNDQLFCPDKLIYKMWQDGRHSFASCLGGLFIYTRPVI